MPSRRPDRFLVAYNSLLETAEGEVEVIVGQNPDCRFPVPVEVFVSPSGPSKRTYEMAPLAKGEVLMQGSDDFIWRTKGWDTKLLAYARQDPLACYFFNDGHEPMDSRIPVVPRKFYETVGYFPPYFFHFYGDTWVAKIAEGAGCLKPAMDVVIEHMHPKFNKSQHDAVYRMRGEADQKTWDATEPERKALIEKLKEARNTNGFFRNRGWLHTRIASEAR